MKFVEKESYAHKYAKRLLAKWLRDLSAEINANDYVTFGELSWRINRGAPHWGVWLEYPALANGHGLIHVWDETDPRWIERPPTFEELKSQQQTPKFIFDIAIQHKGHITTIIEIVHKNPPNHEKITFLQEQGIELWAITTDWVLGQVERPTGIPIEFKVEHFGNDYFCHASNIHLKKTYKESWYCDGDLLE